MSDTKKLLSDLAKAKAVFQLRAITAAMGIDEATQWNEYRNHGGKLDFTAWQEKQEIQCDTCGDHHKADEVPFTRQTGDRQ